MSDHEVEEHPELMQKRARTVRIQRVTVVAVMAFFALLMGILIWDAITGMKARGELLSCTLPQGECYQRGIEQQRAAIRMIYDQGLDREKDTRHIIVLAAYCAKKPGIRTEQQIQQCIEERM